MIAPYWHDFDLRKGGTIYYRQTAEYYLLQSFHTLLLDNKVPDATIFDTANLVIVTWDVVPPYGFSYNGTNTLQAVLATDGANVSYVAFIYSDIQWGPGAQIGFNGGGHGNAYFTLPGALSSNTLNISQMSNVGLPGLYIYRVDGKLCLQVNGT